MKCRALILVFLINLIFCPVEAALRDVVRYPKLEEEKTPARVLKFPADRSFGGIAILDKPVFELESVGDQKSLTQKAQGTINVPANKFVVFFPNHLYISAPHSLDALPNNAFEHVYMRYMSMDDSEDNRGNPALAYFSRFTSIRCLNLEKCEITDVGLKALKNLHKLEILALFSTEIDGSFLKEISAVKSLRFLAVNNTGFKGAQLQYLGQFPVLTSLDISHLRLTDRDVKALSSCKSLKVLALAGNPDLSDATIPTLLSLPLLKTLDIRATAISVAGRKQLAQKGIEIHCSDNNVRPKSAKAVNNGLDGLFTPMSRGRGL